MNNSEDIQELTILPYPYESNPLFKKNFYESFLKRVFDFCLGLLLLPIILPILALLMIAVKISSSGPAIYKSDRMGRDGKKFKIYKIRTMWSDASERLQSLLNSNPQLRSEWEKDQKLKSDPRITPIGKILRTLSLDELPQIFNILKGEMSFVGPRPIVESEIIKYGPHFKDYKQVRPGLTGLWQVSGRNDVMYAQRIKLDSHYARSISLILDTKIFLKTLLVVLFRKGAY